MKTKELVLIYALITNQLKELIRYDLTLDQEAREAIFHLFDLLHEKPLNNTQLGRAVRQGIYKKRIHILWGRYFNAYYSIPTNCMAYRKHVQDIMHDMQGAVPGQVVDFPDIERLPPPKAHAFHQLLRQGKIKIRAYLPGKSEGTLRLLIVPQVPLTEFDTLKGVWIYKGLTVSVKKPYVSYKGIDLEFDKDTDLFTILKLCVQRAEELVPFSVIHKECGKKATASKKQRNQNIKNRIFTINTKLQEQKGCPMVHKDGDNAYIG